MIKTRNKIVILIVVAVMLTMLSTMGVGGIAFANTYGSINSDDLWYYNSANLYIDGARTVIQGWNIPGDATMDAALKANPVIIACVDTGCTLVHEVFSGVILQDSKGNDVTYNAYDKSSNVEDNSTDKHGTAMMGVMAMIIKDLGLQDYIKLVPVKASYTKSSKQGTSTVYTESFPLSATIEAINYGYQTLGADVVNFSYGIAASQVDTSAGSTTNWITDAGLLTAIANASADSVLIAAAGNNNSNSSDDAYYIAAHENVIGVMGYGADLKKVDTTNFGNHYQLYAPGSEITTATGASGYKQNGKGTSYSSAITSVCAAIFKLRTRVEKSPMTALNVARVMRVHSNSYITYSYAAQGEEPVQYKQPKINLYNLLTEDYSDVEHDYEDPTGIVISQTGEQFKEVYDEEMGKNIRLATINIHSDGLVNIRAALTPLGHVDSALEDNITWQIGDMHGVRKTIDSGKELSYHITQKDVLTSTEQTARIEIVAQYGAFEDIWYVDFQFDAYNNNSDVKIVPGKGINNNDVAFLHNSVTIKIEGMDYINKNVGIMWYLNGEEFATTKEAELTFTPAEEGTYTISARYLGWPTNILNEVTFTVTLDIWKIVTIAICGAIGVAAIAVVLAIFIKRAQIKKKAVKQAIEEKAICEEYEDNE